MNVKTRVGRTCEKSRAGVSPAPAGGKTVSREANLTGPEDQPASCRGASDRSLRRLAQLLSNVQDRRQNGESRSCAESSPSPRDEGVGRGTGRGEVPLNAVRRRPQSLQRCLSPWP